MNTFWGCETEDLTELSAVVEARAGRLGTLVRDTALRARAVAWFGPDAEDHRLRAEDLAERVIDLVEKLRELGELLDDEAEEQEICSRPENGAAPASGPFGVRTEASDDAGDFGHQPVLGGTGGSAPPSPTISVAPESSRFEGDWPFRIPEGLPSLQGAPQGHPMIGGPFMDEKAWQQARDRGPLPAGEDVALSPEHLAEAEHLRTRAGRLHPLLGAPQMMMRTHEAIGGVYDSVEQGLVESGHGHLTPLVSLARLPHDIAGGALEEPSVLGQVTSAVDRGVANVLQTEEEVFTEASEGDTAGAVRAMERGLYRHTGMLADIATSTAVPAAADTASDLIGTGAEVAEPFSPEAAEALREAESSVRDVGLTWEQGQETITDPALYYDARRTLYPMPWDPQG